MNFTAEVAVVAFALFLLVVTALTFTKPAVAERFFNTFARSARAHYTEQIIRLVVGVSLVLASPLMWQSKLFWIAGWVIVFSSMALILTPWQWHFRFGEKIRPALIKHMKVYAACIFVFAVVLLYGVIAGWHRASG